MTLILPKELARAMELMDQAKLGEAFEIIENFEKGELISPEDQLSALLMKGRIYLYKERTRKALRTFEVAYQMSQELGLMSESVIALTGKAWIGMIGDLDKASAYVIDAERTLDSLADDPFTKVLRMNLLLIKTWILLNKGNINGAAETARECLILSEEEKLGNKMDLALTFLALGWINLAQGDFDEALKYAMKSLELNKELNRAVAIATNYTLITRIYLGEGDYDSTLRYCKLNLSIKEITGRSKLEALRNLSSVYYLKSDLNRALRYRLQAVELAEKLNFTDLLIRNLNSLGFLHKMSGKNDLAIESWERALMLSEKWGLIPHMARSLGLLTETYTNQGSREKANRYFFHLSELYDQTKEKGEVNIYYRYLYSKAYMMKSSDRMRDRVEAQALFKELIDLTQFNLEDLISCMGNLCDLLLEELSMYNSPEILDEIMPLINKSLNIAETEHNYYWLAETKLLQAKLALIKMKFEEAKKLMVEAQRIADLHGLDLLAWGISIEHDKLLEQVDVWDTLKEEEAPISERIKLASTSGVLERIQGKHAVEPPESVDEQSTVLLILAEGGALVFSYPFSNEWGIDEDLFSSFLSAFTSFSIEFFSKGLDRVKFGDEMMLMESIGSFSFCYLFKGQTYLARQKLTKFIEEIQNDSSLLQSLEQHYNTSQILELKESPHLESLITEIFTSSS